MLDFIVSVETIEIDVAGVTTASGSLTKGQDYLNCIAFLTHNANSNNLNTHFFDVYFGDGVVYVDRYATSTSGSVALNIIEFNPDKIKVTQGPFSMSAATTTTNVTVAALVRDSSFLVASWKGASTSNNWPIYMVKSSITTSTNLEFKRFTAADTLTGHYYLVECLNNEFSVQHIITSIVASAVTTLPTPVDLNKTFFISSYYSVNANVYTERNTMQAYFYDSAHINIFRYAGTSTLYITLQIISFNSNYRIYTYHLGRGDLASSSDYELVWNIPPNCVSGTNVILHNQSSNQGIFYSSAETPAGGGSSFFKLSVYDATTFKFSRLVTGYTAGAAIQVIDWDGTLATVSGSTSAPINNNFVKSVEHVQVTLDSTYYETHKYIPLTKNQNPTQCIPFYTVRSPGYIEDVNCAIDVIEGPLLSIQRVGGRLPISCYLNIEVIEFYSSAVLVEKGYFEMVPTSLTYTTVIISGSTGSGVSSLDNSFLQFTHTIRVPGDNYLHRVYTRGTFTSTSTVEFRVAATGGLGSFGIYYVGEFLQGDMTISHNVHSLAYLTNNNNPVPISRGIPIVSYYHDNANAYMDRMTILYDRQFPNNTYAYRYNYVGNAYINECLLKSSTNLYVEKLYYTMDTTTNSGSVNLIRPVNYDSSFVINSTQTVTTANDGQASLLFAASGYVSLTLSSDGTKVYYERYQNASPTYKTNIRGIIYVIDWSIETPVYSGPYKNANSGLINSLEEIYITSSGTYIDLFLSNRQRPDYCVPLVEYRAITNMDLNRRNFMVDMLSDSMLSFYRPLFTTSPVGIKCTILEFNPDKAKVSKYYFYMANSATTTTITIVSLDTTKSFIIIHTTQDSSNNVYANSLCRAMFTNSTTVSIGRGGGGGGVYGVVYIVESLDDSFVVDHSTYTMTTRTIEKEVIESFTILPLVSFYDTTSLNYTGRASCGVTINQNKITIFRPEDANTLYIALQLIYFKRGLQNNIYNITYTVPASTYSGTIYFDVAYTIDASRTLLINPLLRGSFVFSGSSANYFEADSMFFSNLLPDGSGIEYSRYTSPTYSVTLMYTIMEFNISKYYFEGTVTEDGMYVDREVLLYRKSNKELIDSTTSSGIAGFRLESPYGDEHYTICFDNSEGVSLNALIYDKLLPEPI